MRRGGLRINCITGIFHNVDLLNFMDIVFSCLTVLCSLFYKWVMTYTVPIAGKCIFLTTGCTFHCSYIFFSLVFNVNPSNYWQKRLSTYLRNFICKFYVYMTFTYSFLIYKFITDIFIMVVTLCVHVFLER